MGEQGGEKQRLFVAVPLAGRLFEFVHEVQELLPRLPGLRLMREEQFHVTLAFIGEAGELEAQAARRVVRSVPAESGGEASIGGFLLLPSLRKARVVALEMADEHGVFGGLFEHVMTGLEMAGVMQREKRPFRPHLTIARLRDPGPVQPRSESAQSRFAVESVCLYESELRREGAVYTVLERTVLMPGDGYERG
ncbi:MAG: RNA 2',3'-cyclic phosphodiesterase [Thermoleophilia bacterium]|nr:RNA 2',3'-cyclic phosphodiesterase [Thermoleophilia bacterium]